MPASFPPALVLVLGALALPLLPSRVRSPLFVFLPLIGLVYLAQLELGTTASVSYLGYELVVTRVDGLSRVFGIVFLIMAALGGLYAYHLREVGQQMAALLYAGSALGVVFAGDLLTLFIWWEVMALSSTYLIWAARTVRSNRAGLRYFLMHFFGGSLLLAGVLLRLVETGSLEFEFLGGGLSGALILVGFMINAAVPPLHAWLPDAYPEATVTGSVFLSAFTTKTAVYVLARGFPGLEILIWLGVIMALYGVVFAVLENDIRRLLAYHIISQVGYMVAAVGIGTQVAINGAAAHAFAHVLYKGLLFMGVGAVIYATGRSKLTELGGLARAMPMVVVLYLIGAASISGFPLFSGYVSKSMVVYAAEVSHLGPVALLLTLASVGTFLHTGLKLPYFTWFGPSRQIQPSPIPAGMFVGMALAALLCTVLGVAPGLLYELLPYPVTYNPYTFGHFMETTQLLLFTALGFFLLLKKLGGEPTVTLDTDWIYRRGAGPLYALVVVPVDRFFDGTERLVGRLVDGLSETVTQRAALLDGVVRRPPPRKGRGAPSEAARTAGARTLWAPIMVGVLAVLVSVTALTVLNLFGAGA